MVFQFAVFPVLTAFHVNDSLHVARGHFHHNHHAHPCANLLHLFEKRAFGQVLHAHVDGGNDVGSVNWGRVHDVEEPVEHLATMDNAVRTTQD